MLENILNTKIASFCLNGKKINLIPAEMAKSADSYSLKAGSLLVILNFQKVTPDFYH